MSLVNDPEELFHEVKAAEFFRDARLQSFDKQLARFHGPFFRDDSPHGEWYPENRYFTSIASALPAYAYLPPRFNVTTTRVGSQEMVAEAMGFYLNRWSQEINLDMVGEEITRDTYFNWGVLLTTEEALTGEDVTDKAYIHVDENGKKSRRLKKRKTPVRRRRPKTYRISQRHFIMDPLADSAHKPRWMGHGWRRSLKSLRQEALDNEDSGWNMQALMEMEPESAGFAMGEIETLSEDRAHRPNLQRDDIYGWDIWIPEFILEDSGGAAEGEFGTWFTLTTWEARDGTQRYEWLRDPRPYYGHPSGPYDLCGLYSIPDEPYPLGLLTAMEAQITDVNRRALAIQKADINFKNVVLYDEQDVESATRIQHAPDQYFVGIPGFDSAGVKPVSVGGSTREQHEGLAISVERLDRIMGEDDASRGLVTGRGTATEHHNAASARTLKSSWPRKMIQRALLGAAKKAAWYAYHDDRVVSALGPDASAAMGMEDAWFYGGSFDDGSGATFDDLELEIELVPDPASRVGEVTEGTQVLAGMAPAMAQAPWLPWKKILRRLGDAYRMPEMSEIDEATLKEFAGAALGKGSPGQPRILGDIGSNLFNNSGGGGGRTQGPAPTPKGIPGGPGLSPLTSGSKGASSAPASTNGAA